MTNLLNYLWSRIYRKWLWNDHTQDYDEVTKVFGWRCARTKSKSGMVKTIMPCFTILGVRFD